MNKEIICYAIIPLKGGEIKLTEFDNTNLFENSNDILAINSIKSEYNTFKDTSNIFIIGNSVKSDTFMERFRFCFKFLFKY
jgi:hypothetical protein